MTIDVDYLSRYLVGTAGGYLANAVRGDGHCEVCTTRIDPPWTACVHCNRHRQLPFTASLADLVVPLTYAGHNRQSERLLYGYKNPLITGEPSDDSVSAHRLTMSLLIFLGLAFHRPCIERVTGPVDALAVIRSTKGRPDHPLAGLIGPTAAEQSLPLIDLSYIGPLADTAAISDVMWQEMLDINLTGVWHTTSAATQHLIASGGGSMVLISSAAGLKAYANIGHYVAAKHGVVGLMRTLAVELGPHRIRVNSIHPTQVDTTMIMNETTMRLFVPDVEHPTREEFGVTSQAMHLLPIPWVEPRDISNAVLFLASDEARYITGVPLPVDAGVLTI